MPHRLSFHRQHSMCKHLGFSGTMATRCSPSLCLRAAACLLALWVQHVLGAQAGGDLGREECGYTRYPALCMETLQATRGLGQGDLVSLLVEKIKEETLLSLNKGTAASAAPAGVGNQKTAEAIVYCDELLQMSLKRLDQSRTALKTSPKASKADIQTWLSAVLTFQDACKDSINEVGTSLTTQIESKMDHLSMLASNALALANRIGGQETDPGRKLFESTDGDFPDWVSTEDRKLLESSNIKPHVVVAQDGSGDYLTIAEALDALAGSLAVGGRKVISIKAGVYKQKFTVSEDNVMLVGEGKGITKITNSGSVGGGSSMPGSATVVVTGDNFVAKDIAFENSAGADNHQALALRISSDHAVLYSCAIIGHQDTLYAVALRQFYKQCDIYGSIDYIFGNAAAVFQSCNLLFQMPHHKGINTVTASGRSDPGQNTGFVIQSCNIGAGPELAPYKHSVKSYLGRPWRAYARVVVMQSSIDDSIQSSGWSPWSGSFGLSTLYYGEYSNSGPGAATSGRVRWSGFHIMGTADASRFTVNNFIGGGSWIPSSGVSFNPGL